MSRPVEKQLQTQFWLLAMFNAQLERDDLDDAGRARLAEGKAKCEQRIRDLGGEVPSTNEPAGPEEAEVTE